jgi:predicted Zn finger-like uncharacterized protein
MFTVCPKCALTLVVTAADLRVAQGYVRCGRCSNVFNALARLSDERQAGAAPTPDAGPRDTSASGRMRAPASDTSRTRALQEPLPGSAAALKRDVSNPPASSRPSAAPPPPPRRFDDDSIPEDALEFNPDATDVSKVFVEQSPSPQFKAATGTFRALRNEAEESARGTGQNRRPEEPEEPPEWSSQQDEPEGVQFDIELDSELLAEITGSRPRLEPTASEAATPPGKPPPAAPTPPAAAAPPAAELTAAPSTRHPDPDAPQDEAAIGLTEEHSGEPDAASLVTPAPEEILGLSEPDTPAADAADDAVHSPAIIDPDAELAADLALAESQSVAAASDRTPAAMLSTDREAVSPDREAPGVTSAAALATPVPPAAPAATTATGATAAAATAATISRAAVAPAARDAAGRQAAIQTTQGPARVTVASPPAATPVKPAASASAPSRTPPPDKTRPASPVETTEAIRNALLPRKRVPTAPKESEVPAARDRVAVAWIAGTAVMSLLLLVQVINHFRNDLAATSELHGPLTSLYRALGITLVPRWNLTSYEVRQLGATTDSDSPGRITVRASVKNGAHQSKPLPLLRVTLQDRFGNRIASRDVPPQSYLPRAIPSTSLLSSGQRIDAEMVFVDPGTNAVGFEIDACLPAPGGGISCANDVAR